MVPTRKVKGELLSNKELQETHTHDLSKVRNIQAKAPVSVRNVHLFLFGPYLFSWQKYDSASGLRVWWLDV